MSKKNAAAKKRKRAHPRLPARLPHPPQKGLRANLVLYLLLGLVLTSLFVSIRGNMPTHEQIDLSRVISDAKEGKVEQILVEGNRLTVSYKDGRIFNSQKEPTDSMREALQTAGVDPRQVNLEIKPDSAVPWLDLVSTVAIPIGFIIFFVFLFRQARGAQDSIFSFGQSRAKLFNRQMSKITFDDVAGIEEAKREVSEIIDFLKNPKKYRKMGARPPKGVLLVGPSGCGKTLLARAVAGEAEVPFFSMAGSEFMEMLVGVGASRVRDLFNTAKKNTPSVIFIDEIDSIGRQRGAVMVGSHGEQEQTLNQILTEMDGFTPNDQVVVISATNRPDVLDPALVRPGRFDRRIIVDMPDLEERKAILKVHAKGKPIAPDVDWDKVSRRTVGFSGADLENMLNEAAILAAREGTKNVNMAQIEEAATKVKLGPEKKRIQSDEDRKMTAYHEAGHAVVSHLLEHTDPVHRVSIVSRGLALGFTLIPPSQDRYNETKTRLLEVITTLLGGRAAEEFVFDELTVGAANDIEKATSVARRMVVEYGMSGLGPVSFGRRGQFRFLSEDWVDPNRVSPEMAAEIDKEIQKIIDQSLRRALDLLKTHREKLDLIAKRLLEVETIDGEEFRKMMGDQGESEAN
jgi:cell division protease FtsH